MFCECSDKILEKIKSKNNLNFLFPCVFHKIGLFSWVLLTSSCKFKYVGWDQRQIVHFGRHHFLNRLQLKNFLRESLSLMQSCWVFQNLKISYWKSIKVVDSNLHMQHKCKLWTCQKKKNVPSVTATELCTRIHNCGPFLALKFFSSGKCRGESNSPGSYLSKRLCHEIFYRYFFPWIEPIWAPDKQDEMVFLKKFFSRRYTNSKFEKIDSAQCDTARSQNLGLKPELQSWASRHRIRRITVPFRKNPNLGWVFKFA